MSAALDELMDWLRQTCGDEDEAGKRLLINLETCELRRSPLDREILTYLNALLIMTPQPVLPTNQGDSLGLEAKG